MCVVWNIIVPAERNSVIDRWNLPFQRPRTILSTREANGLLKLGFLTDTPGWTGESRDVSGGALRIDVSNGRARVYGS
jgi:hypothetical protein